LETAIANIPSVAWWPPQGESAIYIYVYIYIYIYIWDVAKLTRAGLFTVGAFHPVVRLFRLGQVPVRARLDAQITVQL